MRDGRGKDPRLSGKGIPGGGSSSGSSIMSLIRF